MANRASARGAVVVLLALLALVAYARSLSYTFISDDYIQIRLGRWLGSAENWRVLAADPLYRCRATSLYLTNWTERLFGLEPTAYNASSVALHFLNALLVLALARSLGLGRAAALAAAGFYAVYEGHQEAVIWYAALPELLVVGFSLASLLAWRRWCDRASGAWGWYGLSLVLLVLALYSKESGVVVIPLLGWMAWWRRARPWRQIAAGMTPFALLATVYAAAIFASREQHQFFSDGTFTLGLHALRVLPHSLGRMLFFWGALAAAVVGRDRILRFGLGWMAAALVPYSFLTYMGRVPSRHTYFAAVGLALVTGAALIRAGERWGAGRRWLVPALAGLMMVHNCAYLWVRKHRQYVERARPTELLVEHIRSHRGHTGLTWVVGFPYDAHVVYSTVAVATERDPGQVRVVAEAPNGGHTLRWDEQQQRLLVVN